MYSVVEDFRAKDQDEVKEILFKALRNLLASVAACKHCKNSTCPRKEFNGQLAQVLYDLLRTSELSALGIKKASFGVLIQAIKNMVCYRDTDE